MLIFYFVVKKILDFKLQLQQVRENFDTMWASFTEISNELLVNNCKVRQIEIDKKDYRRLYFEIIDNILTQIDIRFKSFEKLQYFKLLNPTKVKCFEKKDNFPSNLLKNLQDIYGDFFNYGKLQN